MSVEAMGWALNAPFGGSPKLVLIGLANHAHSDGRHAFPTVATLSRYAHVDRRTVQRALRWLEENEYVEAEGKGPNGQANYRLTMRPHEGRQNAARAASVSPGGGVGVAQGAAPVPPEPSINRQEPSSSLRELRAPANDELSNLESHLATVDEVANNVQGPFAGRWFTGFERDRVSDFLRNEPNAVQAEVCRWLADQARIGWKRGSISNAVAGSVIRVARETASRGPAPAQRRKQRDDELAGSLKSVREGWEALRNAG